MGLPDEPDFPYRGHELQWLWVRMGPKLGLACSVAAMGMIVVLVKIMDQFPNWTMGSPRTNLMILRALVVMEVVLGIAGIVLGAWELIRYKSLRLAGPITAILVGLMVVVCTAMFIH